MGGSFALGKSYLSSLQQESPRVFSFSFSSGFSLLVQQES